MSTSESVCLKVDFPLELCSVTSLHYTCWKGLRERSQISGKGSSNRCAMTGKTVKKDKTCDREWQINVSDEVSSWHQNVKRISLKFQAMIFILLFFNQSVESTLPTILEWYFTDPSAELHTNHDDGAYAMLNTCFTDTRESWPWRNCSSITVKPRGWVTTTTLQAW